MDKDIGFDIDEKKTVVCVIQKGKKERYIGRPTATSNPCGPSTKMSLITQYRVLLQGQAKGDCRYSVSRRMVWQATEKKWKSMERPGTMW